MKNKKRTLPLANLLFAGSLVVIILLFPSLFSKLDAWIHDVWLDLRFTINRPVSQVSFLKSLAPHRPPSDEITIVLVDDRSMLGIPGLYAGDKQFYADVLNKLQKHNPKLIALDLFFATDSLINPKGDLALAKAVQECDNLVIKAYRRDDKRITPPFAKVAITGKAAPSYFKNYRGEAIRSVSMAFINEKNELQPSFQSEMWRIYNGLNPGQLKFREQNLYYQLSKGIQNVPLVDREYMLLNYDVQVKNFRTISFFDVYKGN
ncbi:MAG: CHASE2 domain-containing protein, partial [Candidatus Riflebacteria bacterium]|nr:CHASE2 domain-containing protein [Candidatus Riflebacteria bacterium]